MLETSQPSSSRVALRFQLLLVLASFIQISSCLDASASVTIDQLPAYSQQRQCGKDCIQNNYDGGNDVEHVLGCTWNGCYCGTQYQAAATSIITSCWSAYCGASDANLLTYDISTAVSIYDAYCGVAVAAATGVTVPVTTTGINSPTSATVNNEFPSQTSNLNAGATTGIPSATATSKSSGSGSLSSGGIIGISVSGVCSLISLVFTIGFKIYKHRKAEKKQARQTQQRGWY